MTTKKQPTPQELAQQQMERFQHVRLLDVSKDTLAAGRVPIAECDMLGRKLQIYAMTWGDQKSLEVEFNQPMYNDDGSLRWDLGNVDRMAACMLKALRGNDPPVTEQDLMDLPMVDAQQIIGEIFVVFQWGASRWRNVRLLAEGKLPTPPLETRTAPKSRGSATAS